MGEIRSGNVRWGYIPSVTFPFNFGLVGFPLADGILTSFLSFQPNNSISRFLQGNCMRSYSALDVTRSQKIEVFETRMVL